MLIDRCSQQSGIYVRTNEHHLSNMDICHEQTYKEFPKNNFAQIFIHTVCRPHAI